MGNILKDIIFSRRSVTSGGSVHYNIEGLLDKEEPVEVKDVDFMASEPSGAAPSKDTAQSIAFKGSPEGQGIPLAEFLKNAKKQAETSARKIQFN